MQIKVCIQKPDLHYYITFCSYNANPVILCLKRNNTIPMSNKMIPIKAWQPFYI